MHKSLFALASFALPLLLSAPVSADCNDPFGKPNEVLDFHIKMERADWAALKASKIRNVDTATDVNFPACMDKFPMFKAEFRCGTVEPWIKIGVRKKKGTERGEESPEKPPLKLDFNEQFMGMVPTSKGQRWPAALLESGFRKLTLNNGHGNKASATADTDVKEPFMLPLLQTEHVAMRLLNKEIPSAPRAAYAKVTLHFADKPEGEYHGVYILIEDIDHTAIENRFGMGNAKGRLLKASTPDCYPEVEYADLDADKASNNASIKAFEEWVAKDPAQCGAKWLEETKKGLDLDVLLRQEAIREILLSGNDTITNSRAWLVWGHYGDGNNWYAFDPKVGVRQYMPWDVDLTFGNQRGACTTPTPSAPAMPVPGVDGGAPTPGVSVAANRWKCPYDMPLLDWCNEPPKILSTPQTKSRIGRATTCHPVIKPRYLQVMCQLTNGPMSAAEILKIWEETNTLLRPIIPLERDFIWGGKDPLDPKYLKSYGAEYERLKAWIPLRIKSVQEQITKLGVDCRPGCPAGAVEACSYNGGPGARRCMANAWTACQKATVPVPTPDGGVGDSTMCGGDAGALRGDAGPPGVPFAPADAGADAASGAGGSSGGALGSGGSSGSGSGGSSPPRRTGGSSGSKQPIAGPPPAEKSGCSVGGAGSPDAVSLFSLLALAGLLIRTRGRK